MFDALAHLNDPRVTELPALLTCAYESGVRDILCAGIDPQHLRPEISADPHIKIHRAFGWHPAWIDDRDINSAMIALERLLQRKDCVALGECGLDRRPGLPNFSRQRQVFDAQLKLAQELKKPLVLHCVRAFGALLEHLDAYPTLGGYLHGFTGSKEIALELCRRGFGISFGGMLTRLASKKAHAAAAVIPEAMLLIESDTPDHPPDGAAVSEPKELRKIAKCLAMLRPQTSPEAIESLCANNARRILKLGKAPSFE